LNGDGGGWVGRFVAEGLGFVATAGTVLVPPSLLHCRNIKPEQNMIIDGIALLNDIYRHLSQFHASFLI
jgi:hypothetical protein